MDISSKSFDALVRQWAADNEVPYQKARQAAVKALSKKANVGFSRIPTFADKVDRLSVPKRGIREMNAMSKREYARDAAGESRLVVKHTRKRWSKE